MNSYEDPVLSYECDREAEIERLRGLLRELRYERACHYAEDGVTWMGVYDGDWERIDAALEPATEPAKAAGHPTMTEYAELGRIAMKFVDRAGDVCEDDPAEHICAEFYNAMANAVDRHREARGLPGTTPQPDAADEPRRCPAPIRGDDGTVADCIAKGHCGCDERPEKTVSEVKP